ncbi:cytochrome P450 [Suillus subalutaceus]|uniref:cytochrome P450 n=1 Tax=Suillus subalutaceus TaxID=48586 RepID=UPI001B881164|nr:cytochrome P450 [Suillus subalutaceus]KAG1861187.1 cytochrome P450 [Suillus subalutaceus]
MLLGPLCLSWISNRHQISTASNPSVLGTAQTAWDLLETRSDIYSSSPQSVVAQILLGNKKGLMSPYALYSALHARKSDAYMNIQSSLQYSCRPKHWEAHLQRFQHAASVITSVMYGRRVNNINEWIVKGNMKAMDRKYIVELWSWLLHLPWFHTEPEARQKRDIDSYMHLLGDVKARVAKGTIQPKDCLTTQIIDEMLKWGLPIRSMLHFPHVIRKAQAQLHNVIGPDRIPDLLCTDALIDGTLRWRSVAVLWETPYTLTQENEYQGICAMPKNSAVFANLAGIVHDVTMFPDPDDFPTRAATASTDPQLQAFDLEFARTRVPACININSLFINVSSILWAFNTTPSIDLPDTRNYTNGFNSRPVSFDCMVAPRATKLPNC